MMNHPLKTISGKKWMFLCLLLTSCGGADVQVAGAPTISTTSTAPTTPTTTPTTPPTTPPTANIQLVMNSQSFTSGSSSASTSFALKNRVGAAMAGGVMSSTNYTLQSGATFK